MTASYITTRRVHALARTLTDREWSVLATLRRTRVATAGQLDRLHFADVSRRQARATLASMTDRRLLSRLPRVVGGVRAGSAGFVYMLDVAGRRLDDSGGRITRPWPVGGPFLAHSLAVTELYTALVERVRRSGGQRLDFRTEPACWRSLTGRGGGREVLKPDAEIVLADDQFEDRWFCEVDRATESRPTLGRKLDRYVQYWRTGQEQARTEVFPKVLWIVPDEKRHDVLVDLFGRQPVEAWPLFTVATEAQATDRILAGAAA